jgi:hypothetical protein
MNISPINKHTVLKDVRNTGMWQGYILPNNANPNSIWIHPLEVLISIGRDGQFYVVLGELQYAEPLNEFLAGYSYYNCNSELGYRIKYWETTSH